MLAATFLIEPSVCHEHHHTAGCQAHGLPPLFAVFNAVLPAQVQGIVKHPLRRLKTDAVFCQVAGAFTVVLGKYRQLHFCNYLIVVFISLLGNRAGLSAGPSAKL